MNFIRTLYVLLSYPQRLRHRLGYGVQSPWAFELVRDVLFERLHYYAYDEQGISSKADRQLWRLENHFRNEELIHITLGSSALTIYEDTAKQANEHTVLVIDGLLGQNALVWKRVLNDPRATVTFDLGSRGIVTFDTKRVKQNYVL